MTSDDESGTPEPDGPSRSARRSRRAGRTSQSYDFRARFGDPESTERREGLREPIRRERRVAGRDRLTVRELMEQMGVQGQPQPGQPQPGQPQRPAPQQARPPHPELQRPQPPRPESPRPGPERTHEPPAEAADVTQAIPPVADRQPPVDLSEAATAERAQRESRGQVPPPPPLPGQPVTEPTAAEAPEPSGSQTPQAPQTPPAADAAETPAAEATDDGDAAAEAGSSKAAAGALHRRRPLEPTPDLTDAFKRARAKRKRQGRTAPPSRRTAARNTGRILVALACVLTLVGTGYMWNLKRGWNGNWNNVAAVDGNDPNIRDKNAQYGDETYLIVGTDSRTGKNAKIGGGDTTTIEGIRADTILLVNIPADRSRVVAVSWPRDLQVDRPECAEWDPETGDYGTELAAATGVKLNGIYAEGGPSCLVKTLTQMSGLNINRFIAMDFEGFEKVVNDIGGVNVCSTVPLYDYELGYILRKAGTKKLTGRRALNYVRARNISAEGNGDYGRIKRQQLFLSSLLRSTLSSDVLSNPNKLNKIVNTFIRYSTVDNVDTDSLIQLADSMQGVEAGRVTFLTIPTSGTTEDGANNEIPRTDDIDAIFNAIIDDKPLPGEKKTPAPAADDDKNAEAPATSSARAPASSGKTDATAQYPANVSVRVLNGSGEGGVATAVMNSLISSGFNVPGVADASDLRDETVVRYGQGEKDSAATIAAMFPGARIQEDRTVKAGVEIILGSDFQGIASMASTPSPGSTVSVGQLPMANTNSDLPNDLSVTNAGDTTCS